MSPETHKQNQGELEKFMKDMTDESRNIMRGLMEIDDYLASLQDKLELKDVDKESLIKEIQDLRLRIGVLEREDKREVSEEEVATTLLEKLKKWVDEAV